MLHEEVAKYRELSGDTNPDTSISRMGGYLDGYEKALEQEPCEDAISRQAVLDLAKKGVLISNDSYKSVCRVINDLPSVNPQPKTGHWIVHEKPHGIRYLECPYCNVWYLNEHLIRNSYCPNCGAKMVESEVKK